METNISKMRLAKTRRKDWDTKEKYLARVKRRLVLVQKEISVWITNPTKEGILFTHELEEEKELILKIIELVEAE